MNSTLDTKTSSPKQNALAIGSELNWLKTLISARLANWSLQQEDFPLPQGLPICNYSDLVQKLEMGIEDRCLLALSLAPFLAPEILDPFLTPNPSTQRIHTVFGGCQQKGTDFFWPTLRTAHFILGGNNFYNRYLLQNYFHPQHKLFEEGVIELREMGTDTQMLDAPLAADADRLQEWVYGEVSKPQFSKSFPAQELKTELEWEDLVLDARAEARVQELKDWMAHGQTVMEAWGMKKLLRPGYRALFFGKPGTGKTLTATLLGKSLGLPVFRIDLSMVISKYIGETEKNLARVFQKAEGKNWILFFDEADSLFGKRSETSDARDRYANQEISYLLQRIENFNGLVILATNFKKNLDEAFLRRFERTVYFSVPGPKERAKLWRKSFTNHVEFDPAINWEQLGHAYEVTGGVIVNVVRYALLQAAKRGDHKVKHHDLMEGLKLEFEKEGKRLERKQRG